MPLLQTHMLGSEKGTSFKEEVTLGPNKVTLQTGGGLVQNSSKTLDQRGRTDVLFRIVGVNYFGGLEAAILLEGYSVGNA